MAQVTTKELMIVIPVTAFICWWLATIWAYGSVLVMMWVITLVIYAHYKENAQRKYY